MQKEEEEEEAMDESSAWSVKGRNNSVVAVIAPQRERGRDLGGGEEKAPGAQRAVQIHSVSWLIVSVIY